MIKAKEDYRLFMKGITPIVATILLLLITISMVGFAFVFFQRTTQTAAQSGEEQLNQQISQMGGIFRIDTWNENHTYIRNTGDDINRDSLVFYASNSFINATAKCTSSGINPATIKSGDTCDFIPLFDKTTGQEYEVKIVSSSMSDKYTSTFATSPLLPSSVCQMSYNLLQLIWNKNCKNNPNEYDFRVDFDNNGRIDISDYSRAGSATTDQCIRNWTKSSFPCPIL